MYILLQQAFVKSQAVSEQRNNNSDPLNISYNCGFMKCC